MKYVIRRIDQGGGYAAQPGSQRSYMQDVLKARVFATIESAERECCSNERIVDLDELFLSDKLGRGVEVT